VPGQPFFPDAKRGNYLRLSFSTPTPDEIKEGVQRLSRALAD
jgi:DNA-binding transcriptional MocR family regulator